MQITVTTKQISAFVLAIQFKQFLFYLNPQFEASLISSSACADRLYLTWSETQNVCFLGSEPRPWENQHFAYGKTKVQISFAVTAKLISASVFAT